ncbi:MAG: extracellular solute-binding protein [Chloroflexi bacterium]|nr:extracellular solute-binding protein [Chloroflexota bacterium]
MKPLMLAVAVLIIFAANCIPKSPEALPTTVAPIQRQDTGTGKAGWEAEWDKTVQAAKAEGEVMVYMHLSAEARIPIVAAFTKKYGITLDALSATSRELVARVNSEYRAGIHQADVYIGGVTVLTTETKRLGYLSPMEPALILPEVRDPKNWLDGKLPFYDQDGFAFSWVSVVSPSIIYNTDLVKKGQIESHLDLLKPEWKEKLIMTDPSTGGGAASAMYNLVEDWGFEKAKAYLISLVRDQKATVTGDLFQGTEWVARGKFPAGVFLSGPTIVQFANEGAPLASPIIKEPKQVTTSNGGLGIFSKPAHPNATIVFVNWLLSREGQMIATPRFGAPSARADITVTEGVPEIVRMQPGQKYAFQSEERALKSLEHAKDWKEIMLGR